MPAPSSDMQSALRELKALARDLRSRCDAIGTSLDAIAAACDDASGAYDEDAAEDIAADRIQPAVSDVAEVSEGLRRTARELDMRLEDVWMAMS